MEDIAHLQLLPTNTSDEGLRVSWHLCVHKEETNRLEAVTVMRVNESIAIREQGASYPLIAAIFGPESDLLKEMAPP